MAAEKVKLEVPVVLKIDKKSVSDTRNAFRKLTGDLSKTGVDWKKLGKTAQLNARELIKIGEAGAQAAGKVSKAALAASKKMGTLGKSMMEADKDLTDIAKKMSGTKDPKVRAGLSAEANKLKGILSSLGNQVQKQGKVYQVHHKAIEAASKAQQKNAKVVMDSASKWSKATAGTAVADVGKGVMSGIQQGGVKGVGTAVSAVGKGAGGLAAKGLEKAGASEATMAKMGAAVGMMGGAIAAVGALLKLLSMASDHMAGLNKALLKGNGLANDFGMSAASYRKSIDAIRGATIDAAGSLLRFGVDSEKALTDINAFGMAATGSIGKTKKMLEHMGDDSLLGANKLQDGVTKFVTSATVYGKALGVESTEVAKMMGDFVSDIGVSHENVIAVMGDIVKTAAVANIPVHKMMDVFHDVLPDVNLFTNRIEELTGTVKLLSKTMDAKAMKSFMKTMGKGFDELDFKQRLKMAFVIGPDKVAKILDKDFKASGKALSKEFSKAGLGGELEKALDSVDPVKAMAEVAAKAGASGVQQAAIKSAQELARNKAASKKGGVLGTATAMRGAGAYARMNMLEEYAGKMTGGDIAGLGEHVAKQLGVSEAEYKAILALKDNTAMYQASLSKAGKTSSKSMNANLMKIWKDKHGIASDKALSKEEQDSFAKEMRETALKPDELKDMLQKAAAMQSADAEKDAQSMEDLAAEQVNATMSVSDKLESIVGYMLEKIFNTMSSVLGDLDDLWAVITSSNAQEAKFNIQQKGKQAEALKGEIKSQADVIMGGITKSTAGGEMTPAMKKQNAMLSNALKSTSGYVSDQNKDALFKVMDPVLGKVGEMKSKDVEKIGLSGGTFGKAGEDFQKQLTDVLQKAEAAKTEAEKAMYKEQAKVMTTNFVKGLKGEYSGMKAVQVMSHLSGILTGEGVKVDLRSDPDFTASQLKQTKAMEKAADMVKDTDIDETFVAAMGGAGGTVSPPNPVSAQAKAAAGVPTGAAAGPAGAVGLSGTGVMGAGGKKTPEPPPGHDEQIKIMEKGGATQEEIAKTAEEDYQNTSDTLSILKKGIKFEMSWMNSKFKNVLKESTLDSFRVALMEFAVLQAKMSDKTFMDAFSDKGGDMIAAGLDARFASGVGRGEADPAKVMQDIINKKTGAHATGLMGVPYDNYLASLHKGEMVLPASDARMGGKGGGGKSVNVVVYATGVPASEVARRIGSIANTD